MHDGKKKKKKKKGQTLTRHGEKIRRPSRIDGRKDFHIRRYRLRNVAHYLRQKRNFSRWKSSQNNKKGTITQAFLYSDRDEAEGSVEKVFTCIHLNSSRCTWKHHKQKQIFHIAVDAKSKYNLLVFSTFAEKATTRQIKIIDQMCFMQMLCAIFTLVSETNPPKRNALVIISCLVFSWRRVRC